MKTFIYISDFGIAGLYREGSKLHSVDSESEPFSPQCRACAAPLEHPDPEHALLDEAGMAHVFCGRCGAENLIPFAVGPSSVYQGRRVPRGLAYIAIWFVVLGLVLLMMPVCNMERTEPERPRYEYARGL